MQSKHPDSRLPLLVITSYPPRGALHGKGVGGLAWYTKNTVRSISDNYTCTVLAETIDDREEIYKEDTATIVRCWKRGSFSLYHSLLKAVLQRGNGTRNIMLEFEFSIWGNEFVTGFMPLLLIILHLAGFRINIVIHQVVANLSDLSQHLSINRASLRESVYGLLLRLYYTFLCLPCRTITVMDEVHKKKLAQMTSEHKIKVIPLGVEAGHTAPTQPFFPQSQHVKTLLVFGFVAWYKGTDWVAQEFARYLKAHPGNPQHFHLMLAGGESPTQKSNPGYQMYYTQLQDTVKKLSPHATLTGFIPEEEIPRYFLQADLVILPYRVLMSSSGPLSLALTYERPFLLSDMLKPYTLTADFTEALAKLGLADDDVCFSMEEGRLFEKVSRLLAGREGGQGGRQLARELKQARSWKNIGRMYKEVLGS